MTFSVTILGSSGSYASPENPCTGYLLRSEKATVLLDCGPGTLGPLQTEIRPPELTAIVLTHCHPDHWLELPVIRNVLKYFSPRRDVPVYGTTETRAMDLALNATGDAADPLLWTDIDPSSEIEIGDQRWRFALTDHPVETLAVRVDVGARSFAFTADTGPGFDLADLGPGIDLCLCDASHLRDHEGMGIPHLSAREAGVRAREAAIGRLVLTHLVPGSDVEAHRVEAEAAYGGSVEVARPGDRFEI